MIKLIIFDLDDTLVQDTLAYKERAVKIFDFYKESIFSKYSFKEFNKLFIDTSDYYYSLNFENNDYGYFTPSKMLFWEIFMEKSKLVIKADKFYELVNKYSEIDFGDLKAAPGIEEFLINMLNRNIKMAVVSSGFYEWKASALNNINLLQYFDEVVGTTNRKLSKEGSAYEYIWNKFQISPQETLAIGDKYETDLMYCHEKGAVTKLIDFTNTPPKANSYQNYDQIYEMINDQLLV